MSLTQYFRAGLLAIPLAFTALGGRAVAEEAGADAVKIAQNVPAKIPAPASSLGTSSSHQKAWLADDNRYEDIFDAAGEHAEENHTVAIVVSTEPDYEATKTKAGVISANLESFLRNELHFADAKAFPCAANMAHGNRVAILFNNKYLGLLTIRTEAETKQALTDFINKHLPERSAKLELGHP